MAKKYTNSGFQYRKKFTPNAKSNGKKRVQTAKQKKNLYTENWDDIRKQVYRRDGYRCVMCGAKGKLAAHHIVPVKISKNNSLSNLVSVCNKCHRKLESVGFSILQNGGHQADVRRIELNMIMEEKQKRKNKYNNIERSKNFIVKAQEIHGNKYDYSLVKYDNNRTPVKIICPEHGEFEQRPDNHLSGKGCPECSGNKKISYEEFLEKANKVHGDKYDYSLVEYINFNTKIKIINNEDGRIFEQTPNKHIKCIKPRGLSTINTENFTIRAKEIHGERYDYSLVECKNAYSYVKIICPEHGEFEQLAINHLKGFGCQKCNLLYITNNDFITKAREMHGDKYNYSLVEYKNTSEKIKIICPAHGEFMQYPGHHLNGSGCPICNESKGENKVAEILDVNNIKFFREYKFDDCKSIKKLKFDFYIPEYNLCIEYDGKQHFEPNDFFGGEEALKYIQKNDQIKTEFCNNNNIELIRIRYDESIPDKILSRLCS